MEKALNIFKDLCLVLNFNSYWKPRVDEAIAELEEAMKPKTCDGCKHWGDEFDVGEKTRMCHKGIQEAYTTAITDDDFYCNRYEPKDNE